MEAHGWEIFLKCDVRLDHRLILGLYSTPRNSLGIRGFFYKKKNQLCNLEIKNVNNK
jgi:hypothetical protein